MNEFYELLNKSLNTNKNHTISNSICLISREPLEQFPVILECGHKFNYLHIYNYIKSSRFIKNVFETQPMNKYQVKCPYCRNIQNSLIPPHHNYDAIKFINLPIKKCMKMDYCRHINGNGKECNNACMHKLCVNHSNNNRYSNIMNLLFIHYNELKCLDNDSVIQEYIEKYECLLRDEYIINQELQGCNYIYKKGKNSGNKCNKKTFQLWSNRCKSHLDSSIILDEKDNIIERIKGYFNATY